LKKRRFLCNNSVEIILLFIYELQVSNKTESVYIKQEITSELIRTPQRESFYSMIRKVIIDGIDNECFDADIDINLFLPLFYIQYISLIPQSIKY
jgi:hypothetical protein